MPASNATGAAAGTGADEGAEVGAAAGVALGVGAEVGAAAGATASNTARKGFNTLAWNEGGMQFWVISDLGAGELNAFAQSMRARVAESGSVSGGKNPA